MAHGVLHGATAALVAAQLHLQPEVDLHTMELGFPPRAEVLKGIDIGWLIANFGIAANAIAVVVNVEQLIKDTPH